MKRKTKIMAAALIMALAILTGCGNSADKASVPFAYNERIGTDCNETISELKEAGFENVTAETISTTREDMDGKIASIKIDGRNTFTKLTAYDKQAPVVIKYYELEAKEESADVPDNNDGNTEETETAAGNEKTYSADADSIKEMASDLFDFNYDGLEVSYDADIDEAFVVTYRITEYKDITTFVYQNINRYIHFCQRAYDIAGIDRVRFDVKLLGQDQYGKDYEIMGLQELMTRETFDKFEWDNLAYQNIWEVFNDECYYFGVAPEIISDVDTEKIFYDSFERDGKIQ